MSFARISQREARRCKKQLAEMELRDRERNNAWCHDWPLGVNIGSIRLQADSALVGSIRTARNLQHAVVATCDETGMVRFYAIQL